MDNPGIGSDEYQQGMLTAATSADAYWKSIDISASTAEMWPAIGARMRVHRSGIQGRIGPQTCATLSCQTTRTRAKRRKSVAGRKRAPNRRKGSKKELVKACMAGIDTALGRKGQRCIELVLRMGNASGWDMETALLATFTYVEYVSRSRNTIERGSVQPQ